MITKAILVFDDKCGPCTVFAGSGKKSRVISLGYSNPKAQKLMMAQFGKDYGFTLMLFTDQNAYWGPMAAKETVRLAYASSLRNVMYYAYPYLVRFLNIVLRRKRLPSAPIIAGKELPQGGMLPITEAAYNEFIFLLKPHESNGQ